MPTAMYRAVIVASATLAGSSLVSAGCVGDGLDELDQATLARVVEYHAMARVSRTPYASELGTSQIRVWFGGGGVDAYLRIHPDRVGSGVHLEPGSMIVREVLSPDGEVVSLTVMCKGPPGYNPALGDWWFAVTDPAGEPLEENSAPLVGKLAQCYACHEDRPTDDFLFGMPEEVAP